MSEIVPFRNVRNISAVSVGHDQLSIDLIFHTGSNQIWKWSHELPIVKPSHSSGKFHLSQSLFALKLWLQVCTCLKGRLQRNPEDSDVDVEDPYAT